jgi:hypothetical protein
MISSSRPASVRTMPAIGSAASRSDTPSASAMDAGTSAVSVREASSTSRAPSWKRPAASVAARSASRVLPHPPGPVSVTTREARRPSRTAAICGPRPTRELTSAGSPDCCGSRAIRAPLQILLAGITGPITRPAISYDLAGGDIPPSTDAGGNGNREPGPDRPSTDPGGPDEPHLTRARIAHYYPPLAELSTPPAAHSGSTSPRARATR